VGLGVNVDWPANEFPSDLAAAMWSLREASGGRRIDRDGLLAGWLTRLGPAYLSLTRGRFDATRWASAQVTTGAEVEVDGGAARVCGTATGVDGVTGALLLRTAAGEAPRRVTLGEVVRCRVGRPAGES
jgi:biotin-(acetyl-CoA carboxylase) ligase